MRFPGQRYDSATQLNYNYFRDYDSSAGRYVESDPIGLFGGINTYAYVAGRPLVAVDPFGLAIKCAPYLNLGIVTIEKCTDESEPTLQSAKDAKRMSGSELDKACRNNGYKDAHAMKRDYQLDSTYDIFVDKDGNMYAGPRQGTGTPRYLYMNVKGMP